MQSVFRTPQVRTAKLYKPLALDGSGIASRLRDNNFDSLRLIFASMVVAFHMGLLSQAPSLAWTLYISATFAVQAFFVVSGFLVTMSFENSVSMKSYASKRLRRIAPAYVVAVVGAAVGLSMVSSLQPHEYFTNREFWRYLGLNLTLSNFAAPNLPGVFQSNAVNAVNGSLWTIKIEVAFYCLIPLVVIAARRFGYGRVLGAVFIASVLWKVGFNAALNVTGNEFYSKLAKQIPGQLSFFAGGAWAYYRTRDQKRSTGAFLTALSVIAYSVSGTGWFYDLIAPVAVTIIVYWAAIAGPRLPATAKHGDFSYGIYLYHFPLVQTLVALELFRWSPLAGAITLMVVVGVSAVISWRIVEQPLLHRRLTHA
jgi:peptidoglycan/LPS O-acetylase OafA/YrhL